MRRDLAACTVTGVEGERVNPDRACVHEDFAAFVDVARITASDGDHIEVVAYAVDLRIDCAVCGEPFRFIGMPAGVLPARPACSVDETEARLPIRPASSDPDFGLGIPGFAVRFHEHVRAAQPDANPGPVAGG